MVARPRRPCSRLCPVIGLAKLADGPGHVGMYIGQGQFVEAPHTGAFVRVSNLADHMAGYMGAVRPY